VCLSEDQHAGELLEKGGITFCPAAHNLPDSSHGPIRGYKIRVKGNCRYSFPGRSGMYVGSVFSEESSLWHIG